MIMDTKSIFKYFPKFKLYLKRHDDFSAFYPVILENTYKVMLDSDH